MRKINFFIIGMIILLALLVTSIYNYIILPGMKATYLEFSKPDTTIMIHDGRKDTIIKK